MLVHDTAGLLISIRGAILLPDLLDLPPPPPQSPCETCARPCLTACPVGALGQRPYDVPACHAFLDTAEGADCLTRGCLVRRSCPVSQRFGRDPAQTAHHMRYFHK
jgi:epoxyqueuosine reductase QueG